jgi:hypothetical protein
MQRSPLTNSILCAITDADPEATITSFDGIGTFDHIRRNMFAKLRQTPALQPVHAFACTNYAKHPCTFGLLNKASSTRSSKERERERGEPLMPTLHALAQRDALQAINEQLFPARRCWPTLMICAW